MIFVKEADWVEGQIGFIGLGNMGSALIRGVICAGLFSSQEILGSDKDVTKLKALSQETGIRACEGNKEVVEGARVVIIAVKPQDIRAVLVEVKEVVKEDQVFISIAAGIPLGFIQQILGQKVPLIRAMPNTPALIGKGITALAVGQHATQNHLIVAKKIFDAVGSTVVVEEAMMDLVTALSGSGPGFVFRIMEAFVDAGVREGMDRETALRLVVDTFFGASALSRESREPLASLREKVTSPGGTTAAGLKVMEEMGLEDLIYKVIERATSRSKELGRQLVQG